MMMMMMMMMMKHTSTGTYNTWKDRMLTNASIHEASQLARDRTKQRFTAENAGCQSPVIARNIVSDIAMFVMKRDVKLQRTN